MKRCVLLLPFALVLVPQARPFCFYPQPRRVCAEYYATTVVVEARLLRATVNRDKQYPAGILSRNYQMSTSLILRGNIDESFQIHEENDSGRAGFYWVRGRSYLLFLTYDKQTKAWVLDGCGNSGPLSKAGSALARIEMIKRHPNQGMIAGQVSVEGLAGGIPDVRLQARGSAGTFIAKTNEDGQFRLRVPIGHYELHAKEAGITFRDFDFSYERSADLNLQPGGCVQVQITEVGGKYPP
jgi:hypothetical protein